VGYKYVRIRSSDNDVFFILLYHANHLTDLTVLFETGKGKKRCLNVTEIAQSLSPGLFSPLLSFHEFSGCDSTSAFKGKGKVRPMKILMGSARYQEAFCRVGET
jgi:hypothetical protein